MCADLARPLISICIPSYNRAEMLDECLRSICPQAAYIHRNRPYAIEVVVSDNASTDRTESITAKYSEEFDFVRSTKNPRNVGFLNNYEIAFKAARGEYLWSIGDDDTLAPNALNRVLQELDGSEERPTMISVGYVEGDKLTGFLRDRNDILGRSSFDYQHPIWFDYRLNRLIFIASFLVRKDIFANCKEYAARHPWEIGSHLLLVLEASNGLQRHIDEILVNGGRHAVSAWWGTWSILYGYEYPNFFAESLKRNPHWKTTLASVQYRQRFLYAYTVFSIFRDDYGTIYQKARPIRPVDSLTAAAKAAIDALFAWKPARRLVQSLLVKFSKKAAHRVDALKRHLANVSLWQQNRAA